MKILISLLIAAACYYAFFFTIHCINALSMNQPWWVAPTLFLLMASEVVIGMTSLFYAWELFWNDDQTTDDVTSTKNHLNSPTDI